METLLLEKEMRERYKYEEVRRSLNRGEKKWNLNAKTLSDAFRKGKFCQFVILFAHDKSTLNHYKTQVRISVAI